MKVMFGRKGNYPYAVARVRGKKRMLLKGEDYSKMMVMELPEISRFLGETNYQKEMAELGGRFEGVDLIEHATYRNMARNFRSVLDFTNGELHDMLAAYLTRWDHWNVKVILRGKSFGADMESIREDLVPAGNLSEEYLNSLCSMEMGDELFAELSRKLNAPLPPSAVEAYKQFGKLTSIEDYLDKLYYERLLDAIGTNTKPKRLFRAFIQREIDIINLETILMLKEEKAPPEVILNYFIEGGLQIDRKMATNLANAEDRKALAAELVKLDFYEEIKEALESEEKPLRNVMDALRLYQIRKTETLSYLYPLSVIPVFDYMFHKKLEVDNIRIIARGKVSGLDTDTLKRLLVI